MSDFATIRAKYGSKGHALGCPVCGEKNTGAVHVGINALGIDGSNTPKRIGSRMRSFCEPHAVELFTELLAVLEEKAGRA